jgi:hypothetical protein
MHKDLVDGQKMRALEADVRNLTAKLEDKTNELSSLKEILASERSATQGSRVWFYSLNLLILCIMQLLSSVVSCWNNNYPSPTID